MVSMCGIERVERVEVTGISAPTDREWIKSCLSELGEMSNGFKKALASGLEQLVGTVTHRIRPVLDSVATVTCELLEEEYAENQRLVHAVETNSRWLALNDLQQLRLICPFNALCGEGSAIAVGLLKAISVVVNLLLEGRCPKVLAEFMASAPLTPLLKPDNGIRPIAVGAIWRRLASKVAMRGVRKEMSKYLGDFQFGVGVPSGAEASARLYVGDDHIWSTTGVQQGDPLGPLLFALVLHPLVHRIRDCCQLLFHAWYLDDGTIIGDTKEVAKAIDIIRAEGPRLGLELNIKKTEVFWPSCNGVKVKEGLFPRDIGRPTLGVKLLGGAVSQDAGFISSLAVKRASRAVERMSLIPSLQDPQSELFLLCSCMGVAKLLFGLRLHSSGDVVLLGLDYGYALDRVRMTRPTYVGLESPGTILKYRLMIPLFPVDEPCLVCHKVCLDSFGEHAVHCKELPDPLEGRVYFGQLDYTCVWVGSVGEKHACVDLTGVSPLVGLRDNGFVAGQVPLQIQSGRNRAKLINTRRLLVLEK
ncbi:putative reverse transcriptase domain-containing protein [Tanacetum coccineum]